MRRTTTGLPADTPVRARWMIPVGLAVAGLAAGLLAGCGNAASPGAKSAALVAGPLPQAAVTSTVGPAASPTATPTPTPKPTTKPKPKVKQIRLGITDVAPTGAGPYGVAIVISVSFDRDLDKKAKRLVQKRLEVTTDRAQGSVSWAWTSDRTAMYRPMKFWKAGTKVTFTMRMQGLKLPTVRGVQVIGRGIKTVKFTVGRAMITSIDGATQWGTVRKNGKVVRKVPVSMGKEGWRTRNGVKAIMDRELDHVYTNTSVGDYSESYRLVAHYNLRLTWSGEFLHSAPWAYGRLGSWPGSHGCTNASEDDAGWYYNNALYGDPVIYRNTGGATMELDNGLGGPWNVPWKKWKAMAAVPTPLPFAPR